MEQTTWSLEDHGKDIGFSSRDNKKFYYTHKKMYIFLLAED